MSVVGAGYINALKRDTKNILVANYNTLEYCRNMLINLEDGSEKAIQKFENNLMLQEQNITEIGEKETTKELRNYLHLIRERQGQH